MYERLIGYVSDIGSIMFERLIGYVSDIGSIMFERLIGYVSEIGSIMFERLIGYVSDIYYGLVFQLHISQNISVFLRLFLLCSPAHRFARFAAPLFTPPLLRLSYLTAPFYPFHS
jgi:hypothetical protein